AGAGPEYADILESICGVVDDSQAVEQYDGTLGVTTAFVAAHQQQAVQVQWNSNLGSIYTNPGDVNGVRWGSATMIGPDLLLTCGHLFDSAAGGWTVPRQNGTATAISPTEIALNMHVNFLYQVDPGGTLRAEVSFPITQLLEYRLGGLDMALCRVGGSPGTTYGWTEVSPTNPAVGDMLAIIGHPAGMPKRIEAGPATTVTANQLQYNDIDTLGGNSGSGILHAATGRLVGVHTNGGCNSAGTGANSGTAIAAIVAASPTLQALPPSSNTGRANDLILTIKASDVTGTVLGLDTSFFADRLGTRLADDVRHTIRAADTSSIADLLGTRLGADTGVRDQIGTALARDVGTFASGDIGTLGAGDDPNNTWVEGAFDPGSVIVDPVWRRRISAVARPFVQAGPYTPVDAVDDADAVEADVPTIDMVLRELEGAIAAQQAALASLEAIYEVLATQAGDVDQA
ncbi:MAG: trypsin-like peptidase domain-containing protein, partial [Cellulomonadaceae bacterium]|nr:trypsin-like peptidase domain-containing protein [Cellulomonadaceae bacterium]